MRSRHFSHSPSLNSRGHSVFRSLAAATLAIVACAILQPAARANYDLVGVYLTWQRDPATTMTVNWVNLYAEGEAAAWYRVLGTTEWTNVKGGEHRTAGASVLQIRRVELTGLTPDTTYEFVVGAGAPPPPPPPKETKKEEPKDSKAKEKEEM